MSFAEIAALTIHDVKNSLAQLAGQAEARGDAATLQVALNASEALTRLLVFYKTETNILELAINDHVPGDLITELAAEFKGLSTISIVVNDAAAPALWYYDASLVRMLLANAIQNALRFARTRVTISASENSGYLEFTVHDDGVGYSDSVLADEDASSSITPEGTGLGLRLAKRVATMHANAGQYGEILLSNDHGAVFILRLPN
jgi:signal transduction histidine kinase